MKLTAIMLMLLLASSSVLSQSGNQPPEWKIVAQVSGDRIEFKCIEGCTWTLNSMTCGELEQCRWTLDQTGILAYAKPFDYEAELEKGRQEYEKRWREEFLEEQSASGN